MLAPESVAAPKSVAEFPKLCAALPVELVVVVRSLVVELAAALVDQLVPLLVAAGTLVVAPVVVPTSESEQTSVEDNWAVDVALGRPSLAAPVLITAGAEPVDARMA